MFSLFIVLLVFSKSVATKCLFLNDEPCTDIDMLNPIELKYYRFMIRLNKCTGSCNVLFPKICIPKETKDIYFKIFNMISKKDEVKEMTEHISCDYNCKFNSTKCNSKQKWNNNTCQCECKSYHKCEKDYTWILAHVFVRTVSI